MVKTFHSAVLGLIILGVAFPQVQQNAEALKASVSGSLVTIHKLDKDGVFDTSLGFVIGPNQVATAFQAIDATSHIEVVFPDGRKVATHDIWAGDRLKDWVVIKADTGSIPALKKAEAAAQRYFLLDVENGERHARPVEVGEPRKIDIFGDRLPLRPPPGRGAVGGPLLTEDGLVAGIIGGSVVPGSRFGERAKPAAVTPEIMATPIASVTAMASAKPAKLEALLDSGMLTPPLMPMQSLVSAGLARSISKTNGFQAEDAAEFSRGDSVAWVYTLWQKKDKGGKGEVAVRIYDARNKILADLTPQNIAIPDKAPALAEFRVGMSKFTAGVYRVDVLWGEQPVWRGFLVVKN